MKWEVLIVDCDEEWNDRLADLLYDQYPGMSIRQVFSKEEGLEATNEKAYHLIIIDPFLPASVEGRYFVEKIRQFYSINKDTPLIAFTEDIDYVSDLTSEFGIHPETKLGPIDKILNPIAMNLGKIKKSA